MFGKMNPEFKRRWLQALRSNKYKQYRGCLRDGDRFCVLGVLCDISGVGRWAPSATCSSYYKAGDEERLTFLPSEVVRATGVLRRAQDYLINMNDSGETLLRIADEIEEKL